MSPPARSVVMVAQAPLIGGAEMSLLRLAGALDRQRYHASIVAGRDGDFVRAARARGLACQPIALPVPDRRWPWPALLAIGRVAAYLRRQRAALVHINDVPAHPLAARAARLAGVPRLCHLHFSYTAAELRWALRPGFEQAVFASRFLCRQAQAEAPELFPEARCAVIANAFAPPPAPSAEGLATLRRACRLDGASAVIGFAGRVVPTKGVADYLAMARTLSTGDAALRFLVIGDDHGGDPSYRVAMERRAEDLGIAAACRFLGFREDVWDLLHLCDVVVMPSHVEPFGNVVLEAGAAARPLVATRVGGLPEIVRDGDTGVLVPPRDPPALAAAVAALLAAPARRAAMGAAAQAHVRQRFSLPAHARAMADLYDALLRTPPPARSSRVAAPPSGRR